MAEITAVPSLDDTDGYARWRAHKLAQRPRRLDDLLVEVRDPRALRPPEHEALRERCRRANMAVYVSPLDEDADKAIPQRLGRQFGLETLDHNPGADEDAITAVTIQSDALRRGFIPYTDRPIAWHTDGYYNPPERQIGAFILHCVRPAAAGGGNGLIDPELVYLRLRDQNPAHIRALSRPDVMTIPANVVDGVELRPPSTGPVFRRRREGALAMRYTDRRRNIEWRDDTATREALAALRDVLEDAERIGFELHLAPGWGILCNNVLHSRSRFSDPDPEAPRLLYRARYYERIAGN